MSQFAIQGGKKLSGEIPVMGSKNAILPVICAGLLTRNTVKLHDVPKIRDVDNLLAILDGIGVKSTFENNSIEMTAKQVDIDQMPSELVGKLRGSILLMGALLGRERQVVLSRPGGDIIGARPIDTHLDAFEQLGAKVEIDEDIIKIDGSNLKAGKVVLKEFSVTATENALMVAASLPGKTVIEIAATEPHVVALAEMLSLMGAKISGAGTHRIEIIGTEKFQGVEYFNIKDMLEAGLFILLGAATDSEILVKDVPIEDLTLFFKKIEEIGVKYEIDGGDVRVLKGSKLNRFHVKALPQPGIATDLQAPFAVVATQATGTSLIHDPLYEARFKHCEELSKMGAQVTVCDPHRVMISGPTKLTGRRIKSLDIRAGATLILAGLMAEGTTIIEEAEIIERGYENLDGRLRAIGANIERVD